MSEEEKKAITYLKFYIERDVMYEDTHYERIKTLLNLIERQQNEIQYQKDLYEKLLNGYNERVKEIEELKKEYISKDKIRDTIKQLQDLKKLILKIDSKTGMASITYDIIRNDYCEGILQELLEE